MFRAADVFLCVVQIMNAQPGGESARGGGVSSDAVRAELQRAQAENKKLKVSLLAAQWQDSNTTYSRQLGYRASSTKRSLNLLFCQYYQGSC